MTSRRDASIVTFIAALLVTLAGGAAPVAQDQLSGSWEMTGYEGPAAMGKASGLLVFADGRFSLVYTMDDGSENKSGRAHAGQYKVQGDRLTFDVEWSLEYVAGRGSVAAEPLSRSPVMALEREGLTLTFENGGIQRFRRVRAVK